MAGIGSDFGKDTKSLRSAAGKEQQWERDAE